MSRDSLTRLAIRLGIVAVLMCVALVAYMKGAETAEPAAPQLTFDVPVSDKSLGQMAEFGAGSTIDR